jgi:hypothetical protein
VIGYPRCHCGRHTNRGIHAAQVVPCNPERDAGFVIRQLAAVRVRPAHEAAQAVLPAYSETLSKSQVGLRAVFHREVEVKLAFALCSVCNRKAFAAGDS